MWIKLCTLAYLLQAAYINFQLLPNAPKIIPLKMQINGKNIW